MYYRDPKCVHVEDHLARARLTASWLDAQGIPAEVMNEMTLGGFEGLVSILPNKLSFRGVEIWVNDLADADRARRLIAEHIAELQAKAHRPGTVEGECEQCGVVSSFPASQQGTIQTCPRCGATMDVPDTEEQWDVGEPEEGVEK